MPRTPGPLRTQPWEVPQAHEVGWAGTARFVGGDGAALSLDVVPVDVVPTVCGEEG